MRQGRMLIGLFFSLLSLSAQENRTGQISALLQSRLQLDPLAWQEVYILLNEQADLGALERQFYRENRPASERVPAVIQLLQSTAAQSQGPVLDWLYAHSQTVDVSSLTAYWIQNLIVARLRPEAIQSLRQRSDIVLLDWVAPMEADASQFAPAGTRSLGGHEPGHDAIQAPALWRLGYTGYGRKVYVIDDGVPGQHPALQHTFWGNYVPAAQAWFHPNGNAFPEACNWHGPHVAGMIVGYDPLTQDTVGVAMGANWMASPALPAGTQACNEPLAPLVSALQWALNPDGDIQTSDDVPDVINNSWGSSLTPGTECNSVFAGLLDALEVAGIAVVFSAGNGGPGASTISSPKNIVHSPVNTFCVGAVNGNNPAYPLLNASSRGPALCGDLNDNLFKPEVVAPGVGIRSTGLNGTYVNGTGTSMAAAYVSGGILLLKEAFPQLTGTELKYALYYSALDLGPPGEDNQYGRGLIQLKAAYDTLVSQGHQPVIPSTDHDLRLVEILDFPVSGCDTLLQPSLVIQNVGTNPIDSVRLAVLYDGLNPDTLHWTISLGLAERDTFALPLQVLPPGAHGLRVELFEVNGTTDYHFLDNRGEWKFTIGQDPPAVVVPLEAVCAGGEALLRSAEGETLLWYADDISPVALDTAVQWLSPPLWEDQAYYAAALQSVRVGKVDEIRSNGSYSEPEGGLWFRSERAFTLHSVQVYGAGDGVRTVELRDKSGTILASHPVLLNFGPRRIILDFAVPAGDSLQLVAMRNGIAPQLYTAYDSLDFPYLSPAGIEIIGGTVPQGYPFFFDWEIHYAGCRVAVPIRVQAGSHQAQFLVDSQSVNLQQGALVYFSSQSPNATNWQWDFGDGGSSSLPQPSHQYENVGSYFVSLVSTDSSACSDATQQTLEVAGWSTDIEREMPPLQATLFPNPGAGVYTLSLRQEVSRPMDWVLMDYQGKRIRKGSFSGFQERTEPLDWRDLPSGIYLLQLTGPAQTLTVKVMHGL